MKFYQTNDALKPKGHYSQAIEHNGFIFISGIIPFDSSTGLIVEGGIDEQANAVFRNLDLILHEAGSAYDKVLKTTVYIPDISLWDRVNALYTNYFKEHKPARCIVPTNKLHYDSKIELEAIAFK